MFALLPFTGLVTLVAFSAAPVAAAIYLAVRLNSRR
jgi:hypothetical protein